MAFESEQSDRLITIPVCPDIYASVRSKPERGYSKVALTTPYRSESGDGYYLKPEMIDRDLYHYPFLLEASGRPWYEANSFLYNLLATAHPSRRPTDEARRKAARLLDYKLFLESEETNWLDFSGKRLSSRPTYRYFAHLTQERGLSPAVVNQHTGDVYRFYRFVAKHWHDIDMDRVDSVERIKIYYSTATSSGSIDRLKRSQTQSTPSASPVPIGFVRDEGEDLRPLSVEQAQELVAIINSDAWQPIERLIMLTALLTGARKQTILTIRTGHILELHSRPTDVFGMHRLEVGPGSGIDTKNSKKMTLHLPPQLVEELYVYANCKQAEHRRDKLRRKFKEGYPELEPMSDEEMYLFISDQGNPYYMAKSDPRYPIVRSRQTGQVTDTLKRKLLKKVGSDFPASFSFHWLRATYAYLLFLKLQPLVNAKKLGIGEDISFIQKRMGHSDRKVTENYLKLFLNIDFKMDYQEIFEDHLLSSIAMKDVQGA